MEARYQKLPMGEVASPAHAQSPSPPAAAEGAGAAATVGGGGAARVRRLGGGGVARRARLGRARAARAALAHGGGGCGAARARWRLRRPSERCGRIVLTPVPLFWAKAQALVAQACVQEEFLTWQ